MYGLEDDDDDEVVPLTPNGKQKSAFRPPAQVNNIYSNWSSSMALFSPPPPPRSKPTPFTEATINRMTRTPMYHIHDALGQKTQNVQTYQMEDDDDGDKENEEEEEGAVVVVGDDDDIEQATFALPWLHQQQPKVESLAGSFTSRSPLSTESECHMSTTLLVPSPQGRYPRRNSHDTYCMAEASLASSILMGEEIIPDMLVSPSESSPPNSLVWEQECPETIPKQKKSVSFLDLENGTIDRRRKRPSIVKEWSRQFNQEISRVGNITSKELIHIAKVSTQTATRTAQRVLEFRQPPVSPFPDELYDFDYLQKTHKEKIGQMTNVDHEDHFDFALVLAPQAVYSFWSDHLDFRAEHLGHVPTGGSPSSTQGTDDSEEEVVDTIDARPYLTPMTGIRQRRKANSDHLTPSTSKRSSRQAIFSGGLLHQSFTQEDSIPRIVKPRLSLFEKAVGVFSPRISTVGGSSRRNIFADEDVTPPVSTMTARRGWGNRFTTPSDDKSSGDLVSPPIRSFGRMSSVRKRPNITLNTLSSRTTPSQAEEEDITPANKRQKKNTNTINAEDIPNQVIPRGIAVRTNRITQFLCALKRGIILRRHRPGAEAVFVKIFSTDGGDTMKYELVDTEEAILAFKEQRERFNKKLAKHTDLSRSLSKSWTQLSEDEQLHSFSLPDFVAAQQYRKRHDNQTGLKKTVADAATKVKNSGTIKASEIIAVHAARHKDPRIFTGALGVSSLRKSKSEYHGPHSFSIVLKASQNSFKKPNLTSSLASERWYAGDGRDAEFKCVDFEAATEGEYWLLFRGFLLLHRDVVSGRFAAQRAAGFGSNYNRREIDRLNQEDESARHNILQKDVYHEPPTIGWIERMVAKAREIDLSYMDGSAEPGAVPPPSDYFLGFKSPGTQIWSRLRQAGLETNRIYALDTKRILIKVHCPDDRLMDVAEVLRIQLKTRNGAFAPFRENAIAQFRSICEETEEAKSSLEGAALFRSSQRQTIIDFIIQSRIRDSGAELGQSTELGKMIQSRVPLHVHSKLNDLYNGWFYFWRLSNWDGRDGRSMTVGLESVRQGLSRSVSSGSEADPLGHDNEVKGPPNVFFRFFVGALHQPLDSIEKYFGEKIAFYFAWLQHCACHLVFLSIAGIIVTICQLSSGKWDHPIRPIYSIVIMIWSFFVLVNWKKRSNFLAHRWGTKDHKEKETTRPQYHGDYQRDEITQEWIVVYPSWKRYLKYLISFPLTVAFTVGTLIVILLVHANRDLMLANYFELKTSGTEDFTFSFSINTIHRQAPLKTVHVTSEHLRDPTFWVITAGLPAILGLCLPLLNLILMRVSVTLTDFENYRTESEYRTHLIIKVFSFRFVCYFATLYYYSFLSIGNSQDIEDGIVRVGTSVFIYITVTHWWGLFLQIQLPLLIHRWRMHCQKKRLHEELMLVELEESQLNTLSLEGDVSDDISAKQVRLINKRLLLDQAQDDLWREVLLPMHDSFPEYIQAIVQFAFVTCFSVVLPITPIICLVNNLLSMRLDAYKVCRTRNRPLAIKTGGIGVWEHVLHIVTVIAVLTNCWLMGFTSSQFTWIAEKFQGGLVLFCVVVGWEHVMLLIKYIMTTSISSLPRSVKDEIKREQYKIERMRNSNMHAKNYRRAKFSRNGSSSTRKHSDGDSFLSSVGSTRGSQINDGTSIGGGLFTIPSEDAENCSAGSGHKKQPSESCTANFTKSEPESSPFQPNTNNIPNRLSTGLPSLKSRFVAPTRSRFLMDLESTTLGLNERNLSNLEGYVTTIIPEDTSKTPLMHKRIKGTDAFINENECELESKELATSSSISHTVNTSSAQTNSMEIFSSHEDSPLSIFLPIDNAQTPTANQPPRNAIDSFLSDKSLDEGESLAIGEEASLPSIVRHEKDSDLEEANATHCVNNRLQALERRIRARTKV